MFTVVPGMMVLRRAVAAPRVGGQQTSESVVDAGPPITGDLSGRVRRCCRQHRSRSARRLVVPGRPACRRRAATSWCPTRITRCWPPLPRDRPCRAARRSDRTLRAGSACPTPTGRRRRRRRRRSRGRRRWQGRHLAPALVRVPASAFKLCGRPCQASTALGAFRRSHVGFVSGWSSDPERTNARGPGGPLRQPNTLICR
jgi:hypothetical protein